MKLPCYLDQEAERRARKKTMSHLLALEFICPFCGKQCTAMTDPDRVTHVLPMCEKFEQLEPDAFLAAVNSAIATKRGVVLA